MSKSMFPFNDVTRELQALQPEVEASVARVLHSGRYILGPEVAAFETEFAAYCGSRYAIGVNSGTDALRLALMALGIGNGHEVITVANTAVPTVAAIVASGAKPVFADIDPDTYTMDVDHAEHLITPATQAIMPVHLYGQPAEVQRLCDICGRRGLALIEDCAQAHGAEFRGRKVGTFGVAGCFSFYPSKNLAACGDGGLVITDDTGLTERLRALRNYGQVRRDLNEFPGYNSRLQEIQAAILRLKLSRLDAWNERRRALAEQYRSELSECSELELPSQCESRKHVYHLYVAATNCRDELRDFLGKRGVPTLVHYPKPVYAQPAYRHLSPAPPGLPATERATSRVFSLPLFPFMTPSEQEQVIDAVRQFFRSAN